MFASACLVLAALAVALVWNLFDPLPRASVIAIFGLAVAIFFAAALHSLLKSVPPTSVAKMADSRLKLKDRLSSALDFAGRSDKSDFMEAAMRDAARQISAVNPAQCFPIVRPRLLSTFAALILCALAAVILSALLPLRNTIVAKDRIRIQDQSQAKLEAGLLKDSAVRNGDRKAEEIAREIEKILQQLERGELTREEALQRIAELQRQIGEKNQSQPDQDLKQMASAFARSEASSEIAKQLDQGNLNQAAQEMRDLAEKLAQERLSEQQSNSLKDALNQAAQAGQQSNNQSMQQMGQNFRQGASDLQQKDQRGASEQMKDAARNLEQLAQQQSQGQRMNNAMRQLEELKTAVRFAERAGSGDSKQQSGQSGSSSQEQAKEKGQGQGQGEGRSQQQGASNQNPKQDDQNQGRGGNQAGAQEGSKEHSSPTERAEAKQTDKVEGERSQEKVEMQIDKNPDAKSSVAYREAFANYNAAAQEAIAREEIPPSYKLYVKRYFQAIKPKK